MPQYTFTSDMNFIEIIDSIALKENRSRSEMISILLKIGVREKTRDRSVKKSNIKNKSSDSC